MDFMDQRCESNILYFLRRLLYLGNVSIRNIRRIYRRRKKCENIYKMDIKLDVNCFVKFKK